MLFRSRPHPAMVEPARPPCLLTVAIAVGAALQSTARPGRSRLRECGRRDWRLAGLSSALAFPDSVRPHRRQPTRPRSPWGSLGKNTGVGCHFLLPCMKGKSEREVAQWCPTLNQPMDCSLPGSSIHGIFHARVLEWGAIAFSHIYAQACLNN